MFLSNSSHAVENDLDCPVSIHSFLSNKSHIIPKKILQTLFLLRGTIFPTRDANQVDFPNGHKGDGKEKPQHSAGCWPTLLL